MSKNRLYLYDIDGKLAKKISEYSPTLVSEVELPPFSKNRKLNGKCAVCCTNFNRIPIGTKLTLAFGDPRIIRDATLVSKKKKDAPKDVRAIAKKHYWIKILTFEYRGKRFWSEDDSVCRLEDLLI